MHERPVLQPAGAVAIGHALPRSSGPAAASGSLPLEPPAEAPDAPAVPAPPVAAPDAPALLAPSAVEPGALSLPLHAGAKTATRPTRIGMLRVTRAMLVVRAHRVIQHRGAESANVAFHVDG